MEAVFKVSASQTWTAGSRPTLINMKHTTYSYNTTDSISIYGKKNSLTSTVNWVSSAWNVRSKFFIFVHNSPFPKVLYLTPFFSPHLSLSSINLSTPLWIHLPVLWPPGLWWGGYTDTGCRRCAPCRTSGSASLCCTLCRRQPHGTPLHHSGCRTDCCGNRNRDTCNVFHHFIGMIKYHCQYLI